MNSPQFLANFDPGSSLKEPLANRRALNYGTKSPNMAMYPLPVREQYPPFVENSSHSTLPAIHGSTGAGSFRVDLRKPARNELTSFQEKILAKYLHHNHLV